MFLLFGHFFSHLESCKTEQRMTKNMVSTQYFLSYVSRTMDCESPEERLLVIVASNSPAKCVKIITELREYRL